MPDHTTRPFQPELPFDEIPYGYCQCGCGQKTRIAKQADTSRGYVKGEPIKYLRGHNQATRIVGMPYSVEGRFWAKVDKRSPDECWPWLASTRQHGYGQFWDGERLRAAHAYSFEIFYGVELGELFCCHACDNPACVNPYHLFAGNQGDNMRDMRDKGRRYQPDVRGEKNGRYKDGRQMRRKKEPIE